MASKKEDWKKVFKTTLQNAVGFLISKGYNISLEKEYRFTDDRKFRFDYAIKEFKVAFEFEGYGRHLQYFYYSRDCEKYNLATLLGWKVYRFTGLNVKQYFENGVLFSYLVDCILSNLLPNYQN